MTRKEQIKEYLQNIGNGDMKEIPFDVGFECGVEWADAHPHWISVEDELPKETGFYLVVQYDVVQAYWWLDDIKEWCEIFKWKDGLHSNKMEGVTHWMPMPAPPSESVTTCNHKTSSLSEIPNNCKITTGDKSSPVEKGGDQ